MDFPLERTEVGFGKAELSGYRPDRIDQIGGTVPLKAFFRLVEQGVHVRDKTLPFRLVHGRVGLRHRIGSCIHRLTLAVPPLPLNRRSAP